MAPFVRIKKALKIPSHLLEVSYKKSPAPDSFRGVLINRGIYFTTDYQEFEQTLAQAKAFLRLVPVKTGSDEWEFAKKEFLTVLHLIRGKPFKKMYDFWSSEVKQSFLNKYEKETLNFANGCIEQKEYKTAKEILEKTKKIIRHSIKIKDRINRFE